MQEISKTSFVTLIIFVITGIIVLSYGIYDYTNYHNQTAIYWMILKFIIGTFFIFTGICITINIRQKHLSNDEKQKLK